MLIGILLFVIVVAGVVLFKSKNPNITPEQEAGELLAKAETEAKTVESDVKSDASKVEAAVVTEVKVVETDVKKVI